MSTQSIVEWIVGVTSNLRPSQSRTLAPPVVAAVRLERVNLALIGRKMAGAITAEAAIKRAWRFTCNRRVEVADAMAGEWAKLGADHRTRSRLSCPRSGPIGLILSSPRSISGFARLGLIGRIPMWSL